MKRRGFTLVELMVGVGLLGLVLVVIVEAVTWGLRAHRKGEAARQGQTVARTALDRITQEIGTGVTLDTLFSDATHPRDFLSAVVWPDPYQTLAPTNFTPASLYLRERTTVAGVEVDRVNNRVIFTRPGRGVDDPSFNARDFSQFVYVEYVVPPPDAQGRGQHQLLRRVYRVAATPSGPPQGNNSDPGTFFRWTKEGFFALNAYDAANPTAIFNNPNTTLASLPAAQQAAQQVVAELPQDTDRFSFVVEHSRNRDTTGITDPNQLSRYAFYDPSLFTVNVTVSLGRVQSGPPEIFTAVRSLSGQARVKSGE